ncbi:MAG: ABC transporter ATP-binding protein [Planctomycetaceae bacterium]
MSEVIIRCEDVSKKFCRDLRQSLWYGVQDVVADLLRFSGTNLDGVTLRPGEFYASHRVNFEVRSGECLGLIGRNGAGKTTLLKMLNGLIKPDTGRIELRGRTGALIALGAGFNPILSGRENVYVNGSILGLSKREIRTRFDDIVDFAGLGEFIDAPVQSYSSGMKVRLGFAIATEIRPEILLVDEVLAVGDADFRVRCAGRIKNLMSSGCAVVLVSHDMNQIANLSDNALWLEKGRVRACGPAFNIIRQYLSPGPRTSSYRWFAEDNSGSPETITSKLASLKQLSVAAPAEAAAISISSGAIITTEFECHEEGLHLDFTLELTNQDGIVVFHSGGIIPDSNGSRKGRYTVKSQLPPFLLNCGSYSMSAVIGESQSVVLSRVDHAVLFDVEHEAAGANFLRIPGVIAPRLEWSYTVHEAGSAEGRK